MATARRSTAQEQKFDLDLDTLELESESAPPFTFRLNGEAWTLPLMRQMPFDTQLAIEHADTMGSLRLVMGDEQFERFRATKVTAGKVEHLLNAWLAHQGLAAGESQASSHSSGTTARPSKRTSRSGR